MTANVDNSLLELKKIHNNSTKRKLAELSNNNEYKSTVALLKMLKDSNAPLYLYNDIMKWAQKCTTQYQYQFNFTKLVPRNKFIEKLSDRFDLSCLNPISEEIVLPGSNSKVTVIRHDFKKVYIRY